MAESVIGRAGLYHTQSEEVVVVNKQSSEVGVEWRGIEYRWAILFFKRRQFVKQRSFSYSVPNQSDSAEDGSQNLRAARFLLLLCWSTFI